MKKTTFPQRKTHPGFKAMQANATPNGKAAPAPMAVQKIIPLYKGGKATGMGSLKG